MNERRQSSSSSSSSASSSSSSSCYCGGGGIVDSTYVTYVSPSLFLSSSTGSMCVFLLSSPSHLCLYVCDSVFRLSFRFWLFLFLRFGGRFSLLLLLLLRGGVFLHALNAASNKHTHVHTHGQTHTHVHNMLVSENYFAFFLMLLKLVIHSSFAASFVNKQNYSQLTSEMHFFFFFFSFFLLFFELKLILGGQFFVSSFALLLRLAAATKRAWEVRFTCPVLPAGRSYPWNRRGICSS